MIASKLLLLPQPRLLASDTFTKFHDMSGDKMKVRTFGKANHETTFPQMLKKTEFSHTW